MSSRFVAEDGTLKGLTLSLTEGEEWVIGRDPDLSQLVVEDPAVAPRHILCRMTEEGIALENISESESVLVNGDELEEPCHLEEGDIISIGETQFRYVSTEEALVETGEDLYEEDDEEDIVEEGTLEDDMGTQYDTIFEVDDATASSEDMTFAEVHYGIMETDRFLLKVISGPNTGAEFSMQPGTQYLIGTDGGSCDVVFHDMSVSRQHAKLIIEEDNTITIEDLNSRNGTLLNGQKAEEPSPVPPNYLVSVGTTTFIIIDREGATDTIVSPSMPSIEHIEDEEPEDTEGEEELKIPEPQQVAKEYLEDEEDEENLSGIVFVSIIAVLFLVMGMGMALLFDKENVVIHNEDQTSTVEQVLDVFPQVRFTYNKATNQLLVGGNVMTKFDKEKILHNLKGLGFSDGSNLNDNIIIDELIWQETNQQLAADPAFRGVTIHSVLPGQFILTGQLKTKTQAEKLNKFLAQNFQFMDQLTNNVLVIEDLIDDVYTQLRNNGLLEVSAELNNGDLKLTGFVGLPQEPKLDLLVDSFKEMKGIRNVRNLVARLAPEEAMVNLSDQYEVTGYTTHDNMNVNVIINGRILSRGDVIDGMKITSISENAVFLERDGFKYRIEYRK